MRAILISKYINVLTNTQLYKDYAKCTTTIVIFDLYHNTMNYVLLLCYLPTLRESNSNFSGLIIYCQGQTGQMGTHFSFD